MRAFESFHFHVQFGGVLSSSHVDVLRGGIVESRHVVHFAVADAGGLRASSGDPSLVLFARSAIKPLQALPLVDDGVVERFEFTESELALTCASHNGEPRHVDAARALLRRIGTTESALACGPHAPFYEPAARALRRRGEAAGRVHNNCSGKHAGMLALARSHDWPLDGYHESAHPVQRRMLAELARWSDVDEDAIGIAVDGCGVATFALPLDRLAHAFAQLAAAARNGDNAPARVVAAMTRHPEMVGGTDRLCTHLMRATGGRVFVKVGAEGVFCAGVPGAELGIALKVEDGAKRAAEPAIIALLHLLAVLSDDDMSRLDAFANPVLRNTRGEAVGTLRARMQVEASRG